MAKIPENIKNFRNFYKGELKKKEKEVTDLKKEIKILKETISHLQKPKKGDKIKKEVEVVDKSDNFREEFLKKFYPKKGKT